MQNKYDPEQLKQLTNNEFVYVFETIDSTNTYAKTHHLEHESLVIANHQTAGRGRRDHSFYSPKDTGAYFSIYLNINPKDAHIQKATLASAVAVCETLEKYGYSPSIKWVNDIFLHQKKVCGILVESTTHHQNIIDGLIVGIGINVSTQDFPDTIQDIATSIGNGIDRNQLVASIYNAFLYWYRKRNSTELLEQYSSRCFILGKSITYNGKSYIAQKINDDGNLIISNALETLTLIGGEISIK